MQELKITSMGGLLKKDWLKDDFVIFEKIIVRVANHKIRELCTAKKLN
jgi:hypothetical protein